MNAREHYDTYVHTVNMYREMHNKEKITQTSEDILLSPVRRPVDKHTVLLYQDLLLEIQNVKESLPFTYEDGLYMIDRIDNGIKMRYSMYLKSKLPPSVFRNRVLKAMDDLELVRHTIRLHEEYRQVKHNVRKPNGQLIRRDPTSPYKAVRHSGGDRPAGVK